MLVKRDNLTQGENVNPCPQKKTKRENSQSKSGRKQRKERKFLIKDRKKIEEIYKKVFGPDDI